MLTSFTGIGEAVAARRWATLSIVIVNLLVGMATYIGIHQEAMTARRAASEPQTPRRCIFPASSLKAILAAQSRPTARSPARASGSNLAMHRGAVGSPDQAPPLPAPTWCMAF